MTAIVSLDLVHLMDLLRKRIFLDRQYAQYLAVAPFPSTTYSPAIGFKVLRPSKACIQIWTLRSIAELDEEQDVGEMKCEMVLCIEGGPAHELKWCPLPSHDIVSSRSKRSREVACQSFNLRRYPEPETQSDHASSAF